VTYVVFELLIYGLWAYVTASRLRTASETALEELCILAFSIPMTVIMELRNEFLQAGTGTYYPASLAYFPGFKFPIAIILAGSLFAWAIYVVSREAAKRAAGGRDLVFQLTQLAFFLILLTGSRLMELLGLATGYWQWHRMPDLSTLWVGGYLYYFRFSFPPAFVAKLLSWYLARIRATDAIAKDITPKT
jgi:hypothetical protein